MLTCKAQTLCQFAKSKPYNNLPSLKLVITYQAQTCVDLPSTDIGFYLLSTNPVSTNQVQTLCLFTKPKPCVN